MLVALALVMRLAPAAFSGHGWDMYVWIKTSELFLQERLNIYSYPSIEGFPWGFYAYPPPWLYLLTMMKIIGALLGEEKWLMLLLFKAPVIILDVAAGLILWNLGRRSGIDEGRSFLIASLYLLNPVVAFISGVWGMFDSIPALFTVLSAYFLCDRRFAAAGASLGVATAFKIYPGILLPAVWLYTSKIVGPRAATKKVIAPFLAILLVVSAPFLANEPYQYAEKLFVHGSNVGQFTYWALVGVLIGRDAMSMLGWGIFVVTLIYLIGREWRIPLKESRPMVLYAQVFAVFLATAPKINVQYIVTALPFFLLAYALSDGSTSWQIGRRLIGIHLAATVFFAGSAILIGYNPSTLGQVSSLSVTGASLGGGLVLVAGGVAGWEFVRLLLVMLGEPRVKQKLDEKVGVVSLIVAAMIVVVMMPGPEGVKLPRSEIRIALVEGPDSLFQPDSAFIPPEVAEKIGEPTHIVIPLSPDFFMGYREMKTTTVVSSHFKFRLDVKSWTLSDLTALIKSLKASGYKVLAGIMTKSSDIQVFFGVQGYRSTWFENHEELVTNDKRLAFPKRISDDLTLAEYFAEEVSHAVEGLGLDGAYIITVPEGLSKREDVDWVEPLISSLRGHMQAEKMIIVDGAGADLGPEGIRRLLEHADYVVLKAPLLSRKLSLQELESSTRYFESLDDLVRGLTDSEKARLLFSVNVMDFSSGWMVPALQTQLQVDQHAKYPFKGYAIYYVSRYLPLRLTLSQTSSTSPAG